MILRAILAGFLALGGPVVAAPVGLEPKWGAITGKIVWDGIAPENPPVADVRDRAACLAKGAILRDELIVDPKSKGVKNVVLWLVDADDPMKKIPVHPDVARALPKTVLKYTSRTNPPS